MIKNRVIALTTRATSLIFCLFGILDTMGVFSEKGFSAKILMYYTVQSNLLVLALFMLLLVKTVIGIVRGGVWGNTSHFERLSMVVSVDILLTLAVYWAMLAPQSFAMDGGYDLWTFSNLAVHLITPLLCVADYLLYADTKKLKMFDPILCCAYPIFYVLVSTVAGFSGYVFRTHADGNPLRFPYFFIDFDRTGGMIAVYITTLLVFFIGLGYLLYILDRKWRKPVLFPKEHTMYQDDVTEEG